MYEYNDPVYLRLQHLLLDKVAVLGLQAKGSVGRTAGQPELSLLLLVNNAALL